MPHLRNILIFANIIYFANCVEYAQIVHLKNGHVRGIVQETQHGHNLTHKVHLYQGIRYGTAQRFSKPKSAEPWTGLYDATTYRNACVQFGTAGRVPWLQDYTKTQSDDCLYLNVWTPQIESTNKSRSVMVWIHGGGFETGTIFSPVFDGRYMADQGDIVLVSINYRLGPFGFLYGGEDAPGNVGLHDQILSLQWVRQNIVHFGGNPQQVTIFGESAGSWSVGALILSPLTKGLFSRAIMQSGSPTSFASTLSSALEKTKNLAHKLNCTATKMEDSIKCLRSRPFEEFVNATVRNSLDFYEIFPHVYGDELLPIEPVKALKSGKFQHSLDILYGVTNNEGSSFMVALDPELANNKTVITLDKIKQDIEIVTTLAARLPFGKEAAEFYTKQIVNSTSQTEIRLAATNALGDLLITCPTILFAEQLAKQSNTNRYYSYRLMLPFTVKGLTEDCEPWMGVCHATDLVYLFMIPLQRKEEERQLSENMIRAWTNFAKTGNPGPIGTVQWNEALEHGKINESTTTKFMSLMPNKYQMVENFYRDNCESFWKPKIFQ